MAKIELNGKEIFVTRFIKHFGSPAPSYFRKHSTSGIRAVQYNINLYLFYRVCIDCNA